MWSYLQVDRREERIKVNVRQDYVMQITKRQLAKTNGKMVLEVGVGDGYLLSGLAHDKTLNCIGVDISEDNVRVCNLEHGKTNLKFNLIDESGTLPFDDECFDLVVMSEVLEHMPDTELQKSVSELRRVLKPKGRAVITFPSNEKLEDNECKCPECGLLFHKVGHKQSWNRRKIETMFSNLRISVTRERFWRWKGNGFVEKCGGWMMWLLRTIALKSGHRLSIPTWIVVVVKS